MGYDDGPPVEDLTPGDFDGGAKPMKVETDSLFNFGRTYVQSVQGYFLTFTAQMSGQVYADASRDQGSRSFGNNDTLHELVSVANYAKRAAEGSQQNALDLSFANIGLGNAAGWIAERIGSRDGWNAGNVSVVNDAFNPPAGAKLTTGAMRDKAMEGLQEQHRQANLPVVHPSDVKFWNQARKPDGSPYVAGEDYMIEGSTPSGTDNGANPNDPTSGNDNGNNNDNDTEGNEFYAPAEEDDLNDSTPDPYTPPEPPVEDDGTTTLAPGAPDTEYSGTPTETV